MNNFIYLGENGPVDDDPIIRISDDPISGKEREEGHVFCEQRGVMDRSDEWNVGIGQRVQACCTGTACVWGCAASSSLSCFSPVGWFCMQPC